MHTFFAEKEDSVKMAESNKMKEMPVNKLMVQMGIPMILSMALQAVYNCGQCLCRKHAGGK